MKYTLTFTENIFDRLRQIVFSRADFEGAAYVLCGTSTTDTETRLLAREVIAVADEEYIVRKRTQLVIRSESYVRVAKRARQEHLAVLFVHSHPPEHPKFSRRDDDQDSRLLEFVGSRAPGIAHGEMVVSAKHFNARMWVNGGWQFVSRVRVLGDRFRFHDFGADESKPIPPFFDRQVRAFGPDLQRLLGRLHIGVVGAGGTGSAIAEQLARLGVGRISVFDGEKLEDSNVSRVYGSSIEDIGKPKTEIVDASIRRIGLKTELVAIPRHITEEMVARKLRDCDIVFGCTDKHAPRGILVRLAIWYLIPCFDMGVVVDSTNGQIRAVPGRVTTILAGEACLFCRDRISEAMITSEGLPTEQRQQQVAEGYIPALQGQEPSVIMLTTAVASHAILELLHRLTGFMGGERHSSEVFLFFEQSRTRTNRDSAKADCFCQYPDYRGKGDTRDFLGLTWP